MNKPELSAWDAVIFDYGRVLSTSPSREELAVLATLSGVGVATFFELYSNTRDRYDCGHADYKQHWEWFAEVAKVAIPPETVEQIVAMESVIWTKVNVETLDLAREIKARGVKTAILSNMPFDLLAELRSKFDWLDEFEVQIWSCDLGVIKPDSGIYQACLSALECEAGRTLFFDDRPRNVEAARQVGMEAYVFESAAQARAIVERGLNLR
jgi:putative hydrolase of the HAD superfamily